MEGHRCLEVIPQTNLWEIYSSFFKRDEIRNKFFLAFVVAGLSSIIKLIYLPSVYWAWICPGLIFLMVISPVTISPLYQVAKTYLKFWRQLNLLKNISQGQIRMIIYGLRRIDHDGLLKNYTLLRGYKDYFPTIYRKAELADASWQSVSVAISMLSLTSRITYSHASQGMTTITDAPGSGARYLEAATYEIETESVSTESHIDEVGVWETSQRLLKNHPQEKEKILNLVAKLNPKIHSILTSHAA